MNIINTISNKRFLLNGIEYLKNYASRVAGDKIEIFNNYERSDVLVSLQHYSEFRVDGVVFSTAAALQSALLPVIFSRGTLGNDVAEINQDNIFKVQYYFVDMQDDIFAIVNKINTGEPFTISDTENVLFSCLAIQDYFNSKTEKYLLTGLGKGTYGAGGTPITYENLTFINRDSFTANSDPRTEIIPFVISGTQTISQWLNTHAPVLTIQSQADGYTIFKGTVNGNAMAYLWTGYAGNYGAGQLQSIADDFQLLDENIPTVVMPLLKYFFMALGRPATTENVADSLNSATGFQSTTFPRGFFPIVVNGLNAPVIFQVQENVNGIISIYQYLFTGGAGSWGYRGEYIEQLDLKLLNIRTLTISDIDGDVNTVTVDLDTVTDGDFLTAGNVSEHDFGDPEKAYYFVYVTNAVSYTQRFIGTPGIYGGGTMADFTEEMFATGPTSETPPVPDMNIVNSAGNTILNQITGWTSALGTLVVSSAGFVFKKLGYNINIVGATPNGAHPAEVTYTIPAKTADDTFAMVSDVEGLYVPITGTDQNKPVLGDIEISVNKKVYSKSSDNSIENYLLFENDTLTLKKINTTNHHHYNFSFTNDGNVAYTTSDPTSRGITAGNDFSDIITDLDYTQKTYVDNYFNNYKKAVKVISATSYTLQNEDTSKILHFTANSPVVLTVPDGLNESNRYEGKQLGTGQIYISGTSINMYADDTHFTAGQFAVFGLDSYSTDKYLLYGRLEQA